MNLPPDLSTRLHRAFAPLLPTVLALRLTSQARAAVRVRDGGPTEGILSFEKTPEGRLVAAIDLGGVASNRRLFSVLWRRAGVFASLLADPAIPPGTYRCDINDMAREPGRLLSFCTNQPGTVLVPDRGFFTKRAYAAERSQAANAAPWEERDATVLWRGNHSGGGLKMTPDMSPNDTDLIQRARMCLIARDLPGTDIRFAVGANWPAAQVEAYRAAGIAGGFVPQSSWLGRKFAIDIDGNANAFSNLFIRMLYGCCVIKVASPYGFRQWYYDDLEAWTHYVPVEADLSDLVEKIRWCQANDEACRQIAENGRRFAEARTVESEHRATVERIRRAFVR